MLMPRPHLWPHEKGAGVSDLIPSWGQPGWFSASQRPLCSGQMWTRDASVPRSGPCCITRDPKQPLLGTLCLQIPSGNPHPSLNSSSPLANFHHGSALCQAEGSRSEPIATVLPCEAHSPKREPAPPGPCPNQLQCCPGLWGRAQCAGGKPGLIWVICGMRWVDDPRRHGGGDVQEQPVQRPGGGRVRKESHVLGAGAASHPRFPAPRVPSPHP